MINDYTHLTLYRLEEVERLKTARYLKRFQCGSTVVNKTSPGLAMRDSDNSATLPGLPERTARKGSKRILSGYLQWRLQNT
jgi:hypothetical protein